MTRKIQSDYGVTYEELYKMYKVDNVSQKNIGKFFGVSQYVVRRWLSENNISFPPLAEKVCIDGDYFDDIDSEEKAYWLGFVWSDGSINKKSDKSFIFKVDLAEVDINHLEKLKKSTNSTVKIKRYKRGRGGFNEDGYVVRFQSSSFHMSKTLIEKYGMISHRTCAEKLFKNTPKMHHRHLIRGILDADGSVVFSKNNKGYYNHSISFSVTNSVADHIEEYLLNESLINKKSNRHKRNEGRDGDVISISYGSREQLKRLLDEIYGDSNIYLERKFNKYIDILKHLKGVQQCIS